MYSFDIFDTCLTRRYAAPRDLFFDLGRNFLKHFAPYGYDHQSIRLFARLRRLAERQARFLHQGEREDITLNHIYRRLAELLPWNFDLENAMRLEMELEKSSLQAVLPIKRHIEQLRQHGHRIAFISDMYLPTAFIRQCLLDKGIAREDDAVYVSGEWGLRKASGNLFRRIIEQEGIQPHQWVHCGDNYHSDVKMPHRLGIRTHYFTGAHLSAFEQRTLNKTPQSHCLPSFSRLVGAFRFARLDFSELDNLLTKPQQNVDSIQLKEVITTIAAPLLTAYVAWLLQDAQQRGIKRLYFVSRDGQILLKIAQKLCVELADPPVLRYLYGSRQAWLLPSVFKNDWKEFEWIIQGQSNRLSELLNRLLLEYDDVYFYLIKYDLDAYLDREVRGDLLARFQSFIKEPDIFERIAKKAAKLRYLALGYLRQEKLFDGQSWALVDLGWQLNCQYALTKLVHSFDSNVLVQGYYLGIRKNAVSQGQTGPQYAFINQNDSGYIDKPCHWLFRSNIHVIIEDIFTPADHGTVIGYEQKHSFFSPVLSHCDSERLSALVEKTIIHYIDHIQLDDLYCALDRYADAAVKNAELFFTRPARSAVNSLADLTINRDQSHDRCYERKLSSAMSLKEALQVIAGQGYDLKRHVWLEGSAALSSFVPRQLLSLALMGRNILHHVRNR